VRPGSAGAGPYRALAGNREIRALLSASLISTAGDQLARVAVSVLVFQRTHSALLTSLTYALTFLPALIGGPLLGGLADRCPRRTVMISADLIRAVLIATLTLPVLPLPVAWLLLALVTITEAPFDASRAALLPQAAGAGYPRALAADRIVQQSGQVVGFAASGLLLLALTPRATLILDAATFLISAAILRRGVPDRAAAAHDPHPAPDRKTIGRRAITDLRVTFATVTGNRQAWMAVRTVWLAAAVAIVPEGLAAPYAATLRPGAATVGLLLAANPVGNVVGGLLAARTRPAARVKRLTPLTLLVCIPLGLCAWHPGLLLVVLLVACSGAGMSVSLLARTLFVEAIDDTARGRAFALAATGITVIQGLTIGLAGAAADHWSPATVVGTAGILGIVLTGVQWQATRRAYHTPTPTARPDHPPVAPAGAPPEQPQPATTPREPWRAAHSGRR